MNPITTRLLAAAVLASLLGGCSMFGVRSDYQQAQETRPLEIPPGLDAPAASTTMLVPAVAGGSAPANVAAAPAPIAPGPESTLALADSAAGAWRRVGLALERSGVAQIVARDEAAGTFTLSGTSRETRPAEGGFLKRMFSGGEKVEETTVTRVVRISAEGSGSSVRVEDEQGQPVADDLARRVIAALSQRLG
jgi:uncharacterized lipoprotein